MRIKGIKDEDFIQYKVPSLFIAAASCSFKCDKECGRPVCQNSELAKAQTFYVNDAAIVDRYLNNPITKAIVFGGLEPLDSPFELLWLIDEFRLHTNDDIVIYTGYTKGELKQIMLPGGVEDVSIFSGLCFFKNIIMKYGRYIPGQDPHFDPVLGVTLASDNQYAERIS